MNLKKIKKVSSMKVAGLILGLGASSASAAGFALDVMSARATGMGSTMVAHVDEASAIYYNAAGIAQGKGLRLQLGDTMLVSNFTAQPYGGDAVSNRPRAGFPPHIYATYGITDSLSVGVGMFTAFGSETHWPGDWAGRVLAIDTALSTFNFNPEVAYHWGPLRVGAGLQIIRSTVDLVQGINFSASQGSVELAGGAWGFGGNAGVQLDISRAVQAGFSYRSAVKLNYSGDAHFSNVPVAFQSQLKDQSVRTGITLPDILALGLAYRPLPRVLISGEIDYYAWQHYRSLDILFDDSALNSINPRHYHHTFNYHLGGEYTVCQPLKLRAGVLYDPTPVSGDFLTPELPDSNRLNLAVGAGYQWARFTVDAGYQHLFLIQRNSTVAAFPAHYYAGSANIVSLTFGYVFN